MEFIDVPLIITNKSDNHVTYFNIYNTLSTVIIVIKQCDKCHRQVVTSGTVIVKRNHVYYDYQRDGGI